jgi:ketosteroid isomerase-like protein
MKQKFLLPAAICLSLFLGHSSCLAQISNTAAVLRIKKVIEKNNVLYFNLFAKNDAAIVDLYTNDASLLAPNMPPITGKKALKKDFEDTFAAGKVKGVRFKTNNIYGDGREYVTEEGNWQVFDKEGKLMDDGKYLKLWKLTKTGWKIFRDSFNSDRKNP